MSQPADTVLSRINRGRSATKNENATDGEALEKPPGVVEAVRGILAEEGPAGLYRGAIVFSFCTYINHGRPHTYTLTAHGLMGFISVDIEHRLT